MKQIFLFTALAALSLGAPVTNNYVEIPDHMENSTTYSISHFSPKVFMKTDEFEVNHEYCVQFSYKLMAKKVKLRAYTCLLSEGGFCTLDKFVYPRETDGCSYLRPWTWKDDRFSFYFVLERRERKYGRKAARRRVSKRNGVVSAAPIGQVRIDGLMPCHQVCNYKKNRPY